MTALPRFLVAAAHKSSGKTVISTGLARALSIKGFSVRCFKKGPDYIDPMWLAAASGRPCYNLDFNTQTSQEIRDLTARGGEAADVSLIETNKGLFDGVDISGSDSNAALAKVLQTPVVLVIDVSGMTRGIAPLLQGYAGFDTEVHLAGVILNKVAGARHESKLRQAVETFTDLKVLGAVARQSGLEIGERHLGLTTPAETGTQDALIDRFANAVREGVDLDALIGLARAAPNWPTADREERTVPPANVRIGIARDTAFGFYYPDDLEAFAQAGAELVPVDLIRDTRLPPLDGLFLGGGFPECRMQALADNVSMRAEIAAAVRNGLPTYAECGGLMYLCRNLRWGAQSAAMAGVIAADAVMHDRPQGRGHVVMAPTSEHPWLAGHDPIRAHEFHYAALEAVAPGHVFGLDVQRGHGVDGRHDAIVLGNLVAGFTHMRQTAALDWVARFVAFVRAKKEGPAEPGRATSLAH